ncbi:MAG: hypothetical protein JWN04_1891 [Myxococcaceae bacterium]|nr:hypothetical protein [Myxococcaceae bacterium]
MAVLALLGACGDDHPSANAPSSALVDAATALPSNATDATAATAADAALADSGAANDDTRHDADDAGTVEAQRADGGDPIDEVIPKSACTLLTASEVAAVAGFALMPGVEHAGGEQCGFTGADPDLFNKGVLLEEVTNGKAIYAATLDEWASTNMTATPVSNIGDQATFTSHEADGSSMQVLVGDLVLRLNIDWIPDRSTAEQIAGETQLLTLALTRL